MGGAQALLNRSGSYSNFPNKESKAMPALPTYLIESIWEQLAALLPSSKVDHPLAFSEVIVT